MGSYLTLRNALSKETHKLMKQETLLERAPGKRAVGYGNPGELLCQSLGFMVMGLVSWLSLGNHSDTESFLVGMACSAKMDAGDKDSGRWSDMWCILLTFSELFRLVVAY